MSALSIAEGNNSQCAFPSAGISSESGFQLKATLSQNFQRDESLDNFPISWAGYLVLEADEALSFQDLQLIQFDTSSTSEQSTPQSITFGTSQLVGEVVVDDVSEIGIVPFPGAGEIPGLDLDDNSPILFFGQTVLENGQLQFYSCLFFEKNALTSAGNCAELNVAPGDLLTDLTLNIPAGMSFQALKLFRHEKVSFPFAQVNRGEFVLLLLNASPELDVSLLPEVSDVDEIILSEDILPFDLNVQSLFVMDDLIFKNISINDDLGSILSSSQLVTFDENFINDELLSLSFGDDFTSCFFQDNVSVSISNDTANVFNFMANLDSVRVKEFQFNLSTYLKDVDLISSFFLSKPNADDFDVFLSCSGEALQNGAKVNLADSADFSFCIEVDENLAELVDDITFYFRQNRTINTFFIFEIDFLAEEEAENIETLEEKEILLLLLVITSSMLVVIGLVFILLSAFTDFLLIRKSKSELKFEVIN